MVFYRCVNIISHNVCEGGKERIKLSPLKGLAIFCCLQKCLGSVSEEVSQSISQRDPDIGSKGRCWAYTCQDQWKLVTLGFTGYDYRQSSPLKRASLSQDPLWTPSRPLGILGDHNVGN